MTVNKNLQHHTLDLFTNATSASVRGGAGHSDGPPPPKPTSPHAIPVYRTDLVMEREFIGPTITGPDEIGRVFCEFLGRCPVEHFAVALLSVRMQIVGLTVVSVGTVSMAPVWIPAVFRPAILANVPRICVAHNHPSSMSTDPSKADIAITRKLVEAGKLLDIEVVDHVIVGGSRYASLAARGLI